MKERRPQEVLSGQKPETTAACCEVAEWLDIWTTVAHLKQQEDTAWHAAASANLGQKKNRKLVEQIKRDGGSLYNTMIVQSCKAVLEGGVLSVHCVQLLMCP